MLNDVIDSFACFIFTQIMLYYEKGSILVSGLFYLCTSYVDEWRGGPVKAATSSGTGRGAYSSVPTYSGYAGLDEDDTCLEGDEDVWGAGGKGKGKGKQSFSPHKTPSNKTIITGSASVVEMQSRAKGSKTKVAEESSSIIDYADDRDEDDTQSF